MRYCPIALVVSEDRWVRQLIAASLGELGCVTLEAPSHQAGLEYAELARVDMVVLDVCQRSGLEAAMIQELRANQGDLRVVYLVERSHPMFEAGLELGAHDSYMRKPFRLPELCDIVSSWLEDESADHGLARVVQMSGRPS